MYTHTLSRLASTISRFRSIDNQTLTSHQFDYCHFKSIFLEDANDVLEMTKSGPVTAWHMARAMKSIADKNKDLHSDFWNKVYPILKDHALKIDQTRPEELGMFISGFGKKAIQDNELWDCLEKKLFDYKNVHYYMSYDQLAEVLYGFYFARRGSTKAYDLIIDYLIEHKKCVTEKCKNTLIEATELNEYRSKEIKEIFN